ncbi:probable E3 ubiquitin-protein ligase RNF217 [Anoplopoma fimbria]|uniref:probable E3 ubiquitin-protein ligase RNF217 n=1 Tax=Anoplopoma fimbria TaxID=229290 RepID=UPI0023EA9458|nr:probable E3 ubiquitin-protein ligase RNF217 [Anoplopoma fimbria]
MGRSTSGMDDDDPIAAAVNMPSFISGLEEGRARLSRNLATETFSIAESKVDRVGRSNSRLSLDGRRRSGGEEKDARGNNNNNCNGGGGGGGGERRRRASAVEILRRNLGVSKSPSLRREASAGVAVDNDDDAAPNGREIERVTAAESCSTAPFERVTVTARRRHSYVTADEVQHVYCTVYCIDDDHGDGRETMTTTEMVEACSSPDPALYTLDDLVDPFGDMAQAGGGATSQQSCRVCLEEKTIAPLPCCRKAVCDECLKLYVSSQVRVAKSFIVCPIPECSGYLEEGVVISHLANEDVAKYRYFLELSQLDSSTKPCPQCSNFTSLKGNNSNRSEHKYKIQCINCQFVWCFKCHAPWHNRVKCREYRKGDKLLRGWASVIEHGQRNAQKCPQCRIHIQRTEGCDHMTCTQCNTNFCYRCGERYRHLRFFGDHTSNLSVFGCKYRYLPDRPHLRRLIRGSVCGTKVLIAPVVILLVVVLGALALVIGLVVFPVYYVCKRRKKQRTQGSGRWI